ncbi:type II toxin-antitoxin system RelE/ParE family toxin [bacterium]|nr:type II toxin-antitoxin system RelE/ParE family toxin [bacterium]PIY03277.1 MAG: addiction module toxin RelE [Bacteroidetes bacterium CG_4_10_14_3_um_filter_31_20]
MIDYKIILSSEAVKTLQESYEWYEVRSEGLGNRFVELVDKAIRLITQNPVSYPNKSGPYREIVLGKFPYVIVYELIKEEHIIYILHVFHTKRNPKQKYRRK